MSLLDEHNLAEITAVEYPGERLMVCFNPLLAEERRRTREELLTVTEKELEAIARAAARRPPSTRHSLATPRQSPAHPTPDILT